MLSGLEPSDYVMGACFVAAVVFAFNFSLGKPRVWFRDLLGWVIFLYAWAVVFLLSLIVYGVAFGQRVDEPIRVAVLGLVLLALVGKNVILHHERRRGRKPGDRPRKERLDYERAQS